MNHPDLARQPLCNLDTDTAYSHFDECQSTWLQVRRKANEWFSAIEPLSLASRVLFTHTQTTQTSVSLLSFFDDLAGAPSDA